MVSCTIELRLSMVPRSIYLLGILNLKVESKLNLKRRKAGFSVVSIVLLMSKITKMLVQLSEYDWLPNSGLL